MKINISNIKYIILVSVCLFIYSCQEDLDIKLKNDHPYKVVVEGRVVDQEINQLLRITNSEAYFANKPAVGAEVTNLKITEKGSGNMFSFNKVDSGQGYFVSNIPFKGNVGESYELSFMQRGEEYFSSAFLDSVPMIDSINYEYEYFNFFGGAGFYQINMSAMEPDPVGDYYIFNLYVNDTLYNDELRLTTYADDEIINGTYLTGIDVYSLPQEEIKLDTNVIRLEMLSVSREEYNFILAFQTETQANGSIFAGPPADIPTNIINESSENDGLGFFSASSVTSKEMVVYKEHSDTTNNPDYKK